MIMKTHKIKWIKNWDDYGNTMWELPCSGAGAEYFFRIKQSYEDDGILYLDMSDHEVRDYCGIGCWKSLDDAKEYLYNKYLRLARMHDKDYDEDVEDYDDNLDEEMDESIDDCDEDCDEEVEDYDEDLENQEVDNVTTFMYTFKCVKRTQGGIYYEGLVSKIKYVLKDYKYKFNKKPTIKRFVVGIDVPPITDVICGLSFVSDYDWSIAVDSVQLVLV